MQKQKYWKFWGSLSQISDAEIIKFWRKRFQHDASSLREKAKASNPSQIIFSHMLILCKMIKKIQSCEFKEEKVIKTPMSKFKSESLTTQNVLMFFFYRLNLKCALNIIAHFEKSPPANPSLVVPQVKPGALWLSEGFRFPFVS